MADYIYDTNDGKLHTRYSDLSRCKTKHGTIAVAKQMVYQTKRYSTFAMDFGTKRHEMWSEESLETGKTPECFNKGLGISYDVLHVEQQWDYELTKDVILHSRTDAYAPEISAVIDYKTFTKDGGMASYMASDKLAQMYTYAMQLMASGFKVNKGIFLGEQWNTERTELLGYAKLEVDITVLQIAANKKEMIRRADMLLVTTRLLTDGADTLTVAFAKNS